MVVVRTTVLVVCVVIAFDTDCIAGVVVLAAVATLPALVVGATPICAAYSSIKRTAQSTSFGVSVVELMMPSIIVCRSENESIAIR